MGGLQQSAALAVGGGIGAFSNLRVGLKGKSLVADEGDYLFILQAAIVILELCKGAFEVRFAGKRGLLRLLPVINPGKVNHKIALIYVVAKQFKDRRCRGAKALLLRQHSAPGLLERLMNMVAPNLKIGAGGAKENSRGFG